MSKIFKRLSLVLAIAMIAGLFAGCNQDKGNDGDNDGTDVSSTAAIYSTGLTEDGFFEGVKALDYVTLPEDYNAIKISKEDYEASDADIQSRIDYYLTMYSEDIEILDRPVEDGDTIVIDYSGSIDGEVFEGGTASDQTVTIGVSSFIPGFLEQIVGHTPSEEPFDINVTFPDEYPNDPTKAGVDAVFTITLKSIIETKDPELNDAFVAENFSDTDGWNTVEEMRQGIKDDMETSNISSYISDYVNENSTIKDIPESVLAFWESQALASYRSYAESYGMELDEFLSTFVGVASEEEFKEQYADSLKDSAQYGLIVQAIAEKENIKVTDETVAKYFEEKMEGLNYDEVKETYGLPYIKMAVLSDEVNTFLYDKAVKE